MHISFLKLSNH